MSHDIDEHIARIIPIALTHIAVEQVDDPRYIRDLLDQLEAEGETPIYDQLRRELGYA